MTAATLKATIDTRRAPMSARELRHYDAAMALALEKFPPLDPEAPEAERRLRTQLVLGYAFAVAAGWRDDEHRQRMARIRDNVREDRPIASHARSSRTTADDDFETLVIRAVAS